MVAALFCLIFARSSGAVRGEALGRAAQDHKSLVRHHLVAYHNSAKDWIDGHLGILAPDGAEAGMHSVQTKNITIAGEKVHVSVWSYPATALSVGIIVTMLYGNRGIAVVCGILVYLFSNSTMKLSVKWVFVTNHFKFPLFVTSLHFAAGALVSLMVLLLRKKPFQWATCHEIIFSVVPIATAVVLSIGAGNEALVLCSAAFTEVIGSTTCLITVAIVILSGLPFRRQQLFPACLVTVGCAVSSIGEMHFSLLGLIMSFVANMGRSLKVTMQQKMMTGEVRAKFDPCTLLFWTCVPATVLMAVWSAASEGLEPWRRAKAAMLGSSSGGFMSLGIALLASCVNATILNLSQLFVTKDLGAVGSQIVVQSKTVLTVLGGMVMFSEPVTWLEGVGFVIVLVGVFLFSYAERSAAECPAADERKSLFPAKRPMQGL